MKSVIVNASELFGDPNLTLSAAYWVNKKKGRHPYMVEDGKLVRRAVKLGLPKGVVYLSPVEAHDFRKALKAKVQAEATIEWLRAGIEKIGGRE